MSTLKRLMLAYFALGALSASTVAVGIFSRFANDGQLVQGWILPLCLATAAAATLVARVQNRMIQVGTRELLSGSADRNR